MSGAYAEVRELAERTGTPVITTLLGISAFPGSSTSSLYYEVAQPHQAPQYHEVMSGVLAGSIHKVAVLELRNRRSW